MNVEKNNIKGEKKFLFIGIIFIVFVFIGMLYFLSKSFALEGFGSVYLDCGKKIAYGGEQISCTVSGEVSGDNYVSSLSAQVKLSENIEFVKFETNSSMWQGNGEDGNIQLYTDNNKSSKFDIGEITLKVKEGIFNTNESITIDDVYYYDDKFEEHEIASNSIEINTPSFSSNVFDLKSDYIISNTKDIVSIINSIESNDCNAIVKIGDNTFESGNIDIGAKLIIYYKNNILKEYDIIFINSSKYDLSKGYILNNNISNENIIENIEVINGGLNVKNNQLVLNYNNTDIIRYDIVNIYSDKYLININDKYIVVNSSIDDNIITNISISENANISIDNNKLNISFDSNIIESLDIYTLYSNNYVVDLNKKYIFIGNSVINNSILENINTNLNISINENKLLLTNNNKEIVKLSLVSINSNKYTIDFTNNYIYTKNDNTYDVINKNLNLVNSSISVSNNKVELKFDNNVLKSFDLVHFTSTNKFDNNNIYIKGTTEYNSFISSFNGNLLDFKVFDSNDNIVTSSVNDNYKLKIYYKNSETLLDTYNIIAEYIEVSKDLNIFKEEGKNSIIYNLELNTKYSDLLKAIDTSGDISIKDSKGNSVSINSNVKTGDVITVTLSSETISFIVSVKGDTTGTGNVKIGDVAKLYQYLMKKITIDKASILAGELTGDGEIKIGDVAKLYQYLMGRISSLN